MQNIEIFSDILHSTFNSCLENAIFPSILKTADEIPAFKKDNSADKNTNRPIVSFQTSRIYLRGACINKSVRIFRKIFLVNINVDLEKVTVHSIVFC